MVKAPRQYVLVAPEVDNRRENGVTVPLVQIRSALASDGQLTELTVPNVRPSRWRSPGSLPRSAARFDDETIRAELKSIATRAPETRFVSYLGTTAHLLPHSVSPNCVCIVQDSMTSIAASNPRISKRLGKFGARMYARSIARYERRAYEGLSGLVVVSAAEKSALQKLGLQCPILVNPNGVSEVEDSAAFEERDLDAVVLGDFSSQRNRDIAIEAFKVMQELNRVGSEEFSLCVAGWDADSIGLPEHSWVTIMTDLPAVEPLLLRARCSLSTAHGATGIRNALLMSLACGAPVIASHSAATAITDIGGASSAITTVASRDTAVKAVADTVRDSGRWSLASAEAVVLSRQFSWPSYQQRFLQFIDDPSSF